MSQGSWSNTTFHTSHVTLHISHSTCHISDATYHMSDNTYHISHVTCHMPYITCHMSAAIYHMSHVRCLYGDMFWQVAGDPCAPPSGETMVLAISYQHRLVFNFLGPGMMASIVKCCHHSYHIPTTGQSWSNECVIAP